MPKSSNLFKMGLFGSKLELKKNFFISGLDMDRNSLCVFRERQGFKVKVSNNYNSQTVTAELGGYFRYFHIYNKFYNNGERECSFFFVDFEFSEIDKFLKMNFKAVPPDTWYRRDNGLENIRCQVRNPSAILENGEIICQGQSYSKTEIGLQVITKDRIII